MPKPIIITLDDEPQVLNAIERDLRQHFRGDYRILKSNSGIEALDVLQKLKQRNDAVALLLVDQRMPKMSGTDFLKSAREYYPDAKKVLLTAYADTEAAIASINNIGLDYYLMKPWDPPEQNLYPILDDLLSDWQATVPLPYDGIRVAGTLWSAKSHDVKDFLGRNRIPYQWLDIDVDSQAQDLVKSVTKDQYRLPVVFFPNGDFLIEPDDRELAEKAGLQTQATLPFYDLIIVGAGPAGLGAAVYGASEGLKTLLIERKATGGQAGTSSRIENYLGFPQGLSGADLARRATAQATRLGAEILTAQTANRVRIDNPYRYVIMEDGKEVGCRSLIIATGVTVRTLDVPGIENITGAGVYYGAALTEAANYKDQQIFVIGGANSAGQGAMFFARYARKVIMLVRGSSLSNSMSQYLIDQINAEPKIEVMTNTEVEEVVGEDRLESVGIKNNTTGKTMNLQGKAMFIFIGAVPHSNIVADVVERNRAGFIITGPDLLQGNRKPKTWRLKRDPYLLETSVPGIFAAGDVRQGAVRRVASAVGEGAISVSFVHQYLKTV